MPEVRMPKMGDGMDEGTILRWLKKEGDAVSVEEPIAEIETDKANVEIPAEDAGVLTSIIVRAGETVPVGAVIAVLGDAGMDGANGAGLGRPAAALSAGEAPLSPPIKPEIVVTRSAPEAARVKASPLARKLAAGRGIDLATVTGSGPGGRIVERDVRASIAAQADLGASDDAGTRAEAPAAPTVAAAAEDVEISKMRRAIARRTVQSKQTVPHFYLVMPVEMDAAMSLLADMNVDADDGKVTVNDLIVKACAVALTRFPDVNVSFTADERIRRYDSVNVGVAVGTDDGLRIPVIPDCGRLTLRRISGSARMLIARARAGALTPQEMSGATFTVTNLGMFGIEEFMAIISPPESAILAVGAVTPEVVVLDDGSFVARKRMRITLSCDHRTVDGLLGARFLKEVRSLLEQPVRLVE